MSFTLANAIVIQVILRNIGVILEGGGEQASPQKKEMQALSAVKVGSQWSAMMLFKKRGALGSLTEDNSCIWWEPLFG